MPTGRPREFDAECALDRALEVFWGKGYEGATLDDLTKAMGINRPSLYAAFGNKESLFRSAIGRYLEGPAAYVEAALAAPTARAVAEQLLHGSVKMLTNRRHPRGCLIVHGALASGETASCIQRELAAKRAEGQNAIRKRFQRAIDEGDLPEAANAAALACFVSTVIHGMAVAAADGAGRAKLEAVAALALQGWPRSDNDGS